MRRAAAQNITNIDTPSSECPDSMDTDNYSTESSDIAKDDSKSLTDKIDAALGEGSPFDRSYFSFEHEYSYDGPDHEHNLGGRALDAIIVSTPK